MLKARGGYENYATRELETWRARKKRARACVPENSKGYYRAWTLNGGSLASEQASSKRLTMTEPVGE